MCWPLCFYPVPERSRRRSCCLRSLSGLHHRSGAANGATCSPVFCGAICVASEQVLQLATSSRCSAYDCEFVAAAQQLGVPLVNEDRAILAAFPHLARSLDQFNAASQRSQFGA